MTGSLDPTISLRLDELEVGAELPVMHKNASRTQLFLYSAASFNPHRIHYDRDYAEFEGHADVLVHGPLQGAWLTQYLTDWVGPSGRLASLNWQNRASALPELDYEFHGKVSGIDAASRRVDLDVWEQTPQGEILMPGTASVVLAG